MSASTAQNLISIFRSAARRTGGRFTTSPTANSSTKRPSSSPSSSATAAAQKKRSATSTKKKPPLSSSSPPSAASAAADEKHASSVTNNNSSSSSSLSSATAAAQKKFSASSTKKKPSSLSPSSTVAARKELSSTLSSDDAALKKYVSSISCSSSSAEVKLLLKNFKAPASPVWTVAAPLKSSLGNIVSDNLESGSGKNYDDESAKQLSGHATALLCDEMDLDWEDKNDDNRDLANAVNFPWLSGLSNNFISVRKKEVTRERKQKWVCKNSQNDRFDRLVQMCAQKMGPDTAIDVFSKLGKETGLKEFNALITICIEKARDTANEDVAVEQVYKAYQILKLMRGRGFPIEEVTYGQFLMYLIDYRMVDEFFFSCELIKEENPDSLPYLAYYEMLLWIAVNNELKVQELCHSAAASDKSNFREQILLALGVSDRKEDFLMLLKTLDITKPMTFALLDRIFCFLGKFSLETFTEKFLLSLKRSDIGVENMSNFIGEYVVSTPNLAMERVEDIVEKFQMLHNKFEVLPTPAPYEKLIKHCCEYLSVNEALVVADKALESGVTLPLETFHLILDACDRCFEFNLVHHVNSRISSSSNLKPNNETVRRMVLLCVKMKDYEGAYRLIDDLQKMNLTPTVGMYNSILAGYLREKKIEPAMNVLKQMEDADVKPDALTYSYLIGNCQHEKDIIKFYDDMINLRIKPTKRVYMAIINAYAACGLHEKAKQVIMDERIPWKNLTKIKSALIGALASNGQFTAALEMYEEIKEVKGSLEPGAIRSLIEHFQSEGESSKLFQLLDEIRSSPHWTDGCFWVISHCVQKENLSSTVALLKKLKDKSSPEVPLEVLFEEVFCLYAKKEPTNMQFGLNLLQTIKEEFDISPSRKSLDFLLSACVNAKDSEASFVIWKEYETAGLPYNVVSFLRMYQSLLASGDRKSAAQILNKMPKNDSHVRCVIRAFQKTYMKPASVIKKKKKNGALSATLGLLDALRAK